MYIFQDFNKAKPINILWGLFIGNTLRAIFLYRLSSWFYMHKLSPIATFFWSLNIALHSCDISPAAIIGKNFRMRHSVGVVIGAGAIIGDNLILYQNVTIGTNKTPVCPAIGNHVKLFAGCVVIGDIKIGDNIIVGANSVVTKDIPSNSISKGVPAINKPMR